MILGVGWGPGRLEGQGQLGMGRCDDGEVSGWIGRRLAGTGLGMGFLCRRMVKTDGNCGRRVLGGTRTTDCLTAEGSRDRGLDYQNPRMVRAFC